MGDEHAAILDQLNFAGIAAWQLKHLCQSNQPLSKMASTRAFSGAEVESCLVSDVRDRAALADKIVVLYKNGTLPAPFGVSDIRKHFRDDYTENHIRSVMANYCAGTGYWAVEGRTARFQRHSRGKYLCL